ncbi:ABC transporter ATP-binding protein [Acidianus sp. HS-5]|uniref:ABC transporter ATP-binding protein n=1 Tax=Acidianus sp. HS-5 TaxID=2886040 RepID=UPI001F02B876|nr:ABC transporter ATP-binding protein [Acidianus sp. HS-5]BDC17201.1 ABC transporter ATP-binding protein [Acidianus sp. HS-5]
MKFVEIKNFQITYLGRSKPSLVIDNFEIEDGESVLIVGKSGSGKSTLVNAINGVIPNMINAQELGEILVYGKDPRTQPIFETAKVVGTLLQDPESQIFNYTVIDEIAFGPENFMLPKDEIIQRVNESAKLTGIPHLLHRDTSTLSGGEMQRVALASILAMRPKALILDEPTSNIDPKGTAEIFSLIRNFRQEKRSLIIVEHKLERVLPYVDRVVLVDKGRIILDVPKEELIESADLLAGAGVEIPDYYLYLKKIGIKDINREALKGYKYMPPPRRNGEKEILYAKVKVSTKQGKALVDTEISVKQGEILALMGNNGAGKSTLLKAIMGILDRKLKAEVKLAVGGKDLSKKGLAERGTYIGYLPQNFDIMFVKRKVEDEVAFAMKNRKAYSKEKLESILQMFSLYKIRYDDPLLLSMGQRRRVAMASILASGAKILLMDEPTSGQDWYHREMLGREVQELREKGYTFLIVTHDSRFVDKFCDRVVVMKDGKIVFNGSPEEAFSREDLGIYPPTEYVVTKLGTLEFTL